MNSVHDLKIDSILDKASSGLFQIPTFQREFVWKTRDVAALAESALAGLPCGALVTWEHPAALQGSNLLNVRIKEKFQNTIQVHEFPPAGTSDTKPHVVIDGMQRITAIAIAFGGLNHKNGNSPFRGQFFINLDIPEMEGSVKFIKATAIAKQKLDKQESWELTGLYPLTNLTTPLAQATGNNHISYMGDLRQLVSKNPSREKKVKGMLNEASNPIMAEMILDTKLSLGEVAHSFEQLNTQGTAVSVVDILHSTLFEWFKTYKAQDWEMRDWIKDISEDPGTQDWGVDAHRDIILKFGVAIELAATNRLPGRTSEKPKGITIKDILNLNELHWFNLQQNTPLLKECIKEFQLCVLGKQFPYKACPYPISASIYIALYWKLKIEKPTWTKKRLDQIFKAFFWHNALSLGYETDSHRVPDDIKAIESKLIELESATDATWAKEVNQWLDKHMEPIKKPAEIKIKLMEKAHGAMKNALELPIRYLPDDDLCKPSQSVIFPLEDDIQMHHIFPRKWIQSNSGNQTFFGTMAGKKDDIKILQESLINKTPLTKVSNAKWSADSPSTAMHGFGPNTAQIKGSKVWTERFIKDQTYDSLKIDLCLTFLTQRAEEVEKWLTKQCKIN